MAEDGKAQFVDRVDVRGALTASGLRVSGPVHLALEEPPPVVKTDRVLIGDDGKLYRAD